MQNKFVLPAVLSVLLIAVSGAVLWHFSCHKTVNPYDFPPRQESTVSASISPIRSRLLITSGRAEISLTTKYNEQQYK